MSCQTGYLIREEDGSCWFARRKHGEWRLTQPATRDWLLRDTRADRIPLHRMGDGGFNEVYCQGALVDLAGRRFRCYPCYGERPRLDEVDAEISAAPAWNGWDAGVAMGGLEDFADILPEAARVIRPFRVLDEPLAEAEPEPRDDWFADWDRDSLTLTVRDDEDSANWTIDEFDVLTTIDQDNVALDYRLIAVWAKPVHPLLAWLRRGPGALAALQATPPYPPAEPELVRSSATVNHADQIIAYSPTDLVPARLLDAVRSAWPGWRLQQLPPESNGQLIRPSIRVVRPEAPSTPAPSRDGESS